MGGPASIIKDASVAQEFLESIPAAIVVVDKGMKVAAFNRAWSGICERCLGKKAAKGMDITALITDDVPVRMLAEAVRGKDVRQDGYRFESGPQCDRYYDLTAASAFDGAILMAVDSTERCNAIRSNDAARTEAEFYVDLMSHDIRNFNQVTMGYIELLQLSGGFGEKEQTYLEKAQKGVTGSNKLIDSIKKIRLIRQFAGKKLEKVSLAEALKTDAEDVRKSSPSARITLKLDRKEHYDVMADEYIHEIFRHIMENAAKYDPHPEKLIDVAVRPETIDGKEYWSVSIADHGSGIPDDKKKAVFDRMTRTTKGAGVGLSIVSVIVTKYGGRIRVEDRVKGDSSQGSVFIVDLPKA